MNALMTMALALVVQVAPVLGYQHLTNEQGVETAAFASVIGTSPLVTVMIPVAFDPTAPVTPPDTTSSSTQTLSTPVYDAISDTYTVVTTTKASGESEADFIRRHNGLVHTLVANNKADAKHEGLDYDALKKAHDGASSK